MLNFYQVQFVHLPFMNHAFGVISKTSLSNSRSQRSSFKLLYLQAFHLGLGSFFS